MLRSHLMEVLNKYALKCASVYVMIAQDQGVAHEFASKCDRAQRSLFVLHVPTSKDAANVPYADERMCSTHALPRHTDMLIIDTLHVFGQLRRELARYAPAVHRFIAVHGTALDGVVGECVRRSWDVKGLASFTEIPEDELLRGVQFAVDEFLENNSSCWRLCETIIENAGVTVLERICEEPIARPASFSIDASKFRLQYNKTAAFARFVPGSTYCFTKEAAYAEEYAAAFYAHTSRKGGWDCMRHYEIIAAGCVPFFAHLDACPALTCTTLPKQLILEAMHLPGVCGATNAIDFSIFPVHKYYALRDKIWSHALAHCSTYNAAKALTQPRLPYVLQGGKKVLFLGDSPQPDYLRCSFLAGLMQVFGAANVIDVVHVPHVYTTFPEECIDALYGRGFSYTRTVAITADQEARKAAERVPEHVAAQIARRAYAFVVYGSVHRGTPFLATVRAHYAPSEIFWLCGEDSNELTCCRNDVTCFKRELTDRAANTKHVAFFVRHFSERGTEVSTFAYADWNERLLKNTSYVVYLTEKGCQTYSLPFIRSSFQKFKDRFGDRMIEIEDIARDMPSVIAARRLDAFYTQTHGGKDIYSFDRPEVWGSCKTIKHCVFATDAPESSHYCRVSEFVGSSDYPVLPLIASIEIASEASLRASLNIPEEAVVFGCLGGKTSFNIPFVHSAMKLALEVACTDRPPIYFLCMNVATHIHAHEHCIHLPCSVDDRHKSRFIQACDAMLHAQTMGETFGLACAEFALHGKPVFTSTLGAGAHRNYLGSMAVLYVNAADLLVKLLEFKKPPAGLCGHNYDRFSPEKSMAAFANILLQ